MPNDDRLITDLAAIRRTIIAVSGLTTDPVTAQATYEQIQAISLDLVLCPYCWQPVTLQADGQTWHCGSCRQDHTTAEIHAAQQGPTPEAGDDDDA